MATATKPRRSRSTKAQATQAELPLPAASTPAPAATATVEAKRPPLADTIQLHEVFLADGTFTRRETFKYNQVTGGSLAYRTALFRRMAKLTPAEVRAFERPARNTMFALVRGELARYFGTAKRRQDNPDTGAKAGDPLPQLSFPSGAEAVAYREAAQAAGKALRAGVFGDA